MTRIYTFLLALLLSVSAFAAETININTADRETLVTMINGVGDKKADAIVAYRDTNGPFKSVDELANIKGIDKGIIEKNRESLTTE